MNNSILSFFITEMNQYSDAVKERISELLCESTPIILYSEESDTYTGIVNLLTTVSIAHNFKGFTFSERYCFKDPERAHKELVNWYKRGFDEQRPTGWIACRNVEPKALKDSMNKHFSKDYAIDALNAYNRLREHNSGFIPHQAICDAMGYDDDNEAEHLVAYLRTTGEIQ